MGTRTDITDKKESRIIMAKTERTRSFLAQNSYICQRLPGDDRSIKPSRKCCNTAFHCAPVSDYMEQNEMLQLVHTKSQK